MELKYLLRVEFEDHKIWQQDPSDISEIDPKRSQYYDLLQIKKPIIKAWLMSIFSNGYGQAELSVNLISGEFERHGAWFQIDQNPLPPIRRELVFFREHQHDLDVTYKLRSGEVTKMSDETGHRVKYFIGWKVNISGKNYQQIVGIK